MCAGTSGWTSSLELVMLIYHDTEVTVEEVSMLAAAMMLMQHV